MRAQFDRAIPARGLWVVCSLALAASMLAGCKQASLTGSPAAPVTANSQSSALRLSGSPAGTVSTGQSYSFTPQVSSPSGVSLTYAISNAPGWARFDPATGTLSGSPQAANAGTYSNILIRVSDGGATASLPPFSITVVEAGSGNGTAEVSWTPPTTYTDGSTLTNLSGYYIYYGTSPYELYQSVTISNAGVTDYVIEGLTSGTWYFEVVAYTSTGLQSAPSNVATKTIT